jgi:predicted kinase
MSETTTRGVLYLLLGPPGSGKSTYARTLTHLVYDVDDFPGLYNATDGTRNMQLLDEAHAWCKAGVRDAMRQALSPLAHPMINERSRNTPDYYEMATTYRYRVCIIRPLYGLLFHPHRLASREAQIQCMIERRQKGTAKYVPEAVIRRCCDSLGPTYQETHDLRRDM